MSRNSSSEWASSFSLAGSKPNNFVKNIAVLFNNHMNGYIILSNQMSGLANFKAMVSAFWMAKDFGTNSPNTTWKNVITLKAIIKDKVLATVPVILIFRIMVAVGAPQSVHQANQVLKM